MRMRVFWKKEGAVQGRDTCSTASEMSVPRPFGSRPFQVPSVASPEEVGWSGRLSRWQWALAIGVPVAAAAALAGLTLLVRRRRSREAARDPSPPPSMGPTPVASPAATTVQKTESSGPVTVSCVAIPYLLIKEHDFLNNLLVVNCSLVVCITQNAPCVSMHVVKILPNSIYV